MQNIRLENYIQSLESGLKRLSPAEREAQLREVRGHLEILIASHIAQGQTPDEAARLAIRQFGAPERLGSELNRVAIRQRFASGALGFAKGLLLWSCLFGVNLLFYASMNDKPTDFPFLLKDQLLWSAMMATFGFFSISMLKKRKTRRETG
jgi:hypothetical protein